MKLGVVTPACDAEPFIDMSLESALAQTSAAHEVIVVDDCSNDNTREVVRRHPVRPAITARMFGIRDHDVLPRSPSG
ncbi:MAG: glycosyltransferase family 2 protein [Gemmatimonadaceae bacterium]